MATLSEKSRFPFTATHVDRGEERFGPWVPPDVDMSQYSWYQVKESDLMRLDLVAYKTLGDSRLWWMLAMVNSIRNPLMDLTVGMNLKIPTLEAASAALAKIGVTL